MSYSLPFSDQVALGITEPDDDRELPECPRCDDMRAPYWESHENGGGTLYCDACGGVLDMYSPREIDYSSNPF